MASTTTNLGLTKPAYSDDADISDINGNMDLIDAEAGRVRANVAANYDSSETYAVGDYCLHDGSLYKCSTAISSPEAWTAGHWTQIKITGELSTLNGKIATQEYTIATYVFAYKSANFVQLTINNGSYSINSNKELMYDDNVITIPQGLRPRDTTQAWDVYNKIRFSVGRDGIITTTENSLPSGNVRLSAVWIV